MVGITPVILCGGGGSRLWPRSRQTRPKPFLPLIGQSTLFQSTLERCNDADLFDKPVIVTGDAHISYVLDQGHQDGTMSLIVEPQPRNTAAAIALAAMRLPQDAIMLVCPSDHYIANVDAFRETAKAAAVLAEEGWLVAFGIAANMPETGYGYIKRGQPIDGGFRVDRFVEKPDLEHATSFLADGGYSWNGGIFAFRASRFLEELEKHRPDIAHSVAEAVKQGALDEQGFFRPDASIFADTPSESIDYAVMEQTDRAAMVPAFMGWSDIGNWQALRDARNADSMGNSAKGQVELVDCHNVLVDTDGPRVSVIGLEDVAIVVDGNEVLVTSMAGAQQVGKLRSIKES
ncbi:NTP transferase domain-containing protein [Altererythrobacter indicus]|uniref:NTP transferase domain-containing protein n=1 Tax=Altericroceibacterium indicum TaxID=374177 RepID=A0A845AJ22_9SPHN|nr:mannose-1-phosphate guanylyltransferase [Altericroceibacterium indicum]MXP27098.1 NTP transferase domain-containing protein [Altericroceibacterium indicum]